MVQHQIFHIQALRQLAGVLDRGMVLLIRMEDISLSIQAEGLVKKPVASGGVRLLPIIVGLVAAAGQLPAVPQITHVTVLLRLGGADIKESIAVP